MIKKSLYTCLLIAASTPAMAGFQFTAPVNQNNNQGMLPPLSGAAPQMPAVPAIQVQQAPVAQTPQRPVIQSQPRIPVQAIARPTTPMAQPRPSIQPQTISIAPSMPQAQATRQTTPNDLAVGFGKDLPLVTAIRQIVPEGYTYLIDPEIDENEKVSWQGGQAWPMVLETSLSDMNANVQVDGKIVRITKPQKVQPTAPIQQNIAWNAPTSQPMQTSNPQPQYAPPTQFASLQDSLVQQGNRRVMNDGPTSILAPQIQAQSISMQSTEPERVEEMDKSVVPEVTQGQWIAQSGSSLRTVLESWSNLEGVDLFWSSDYDYRLAGDVNISGNFEEAIEGLLEGFASAKPKPIGRLHPNLPHGPAVLVIETRRVIN